MPADQPALRYVDFLLRIRDGGSDSLRLAIVLLQNRHRAVRVRRVDDVAEPDTHVEDFVHLGIVHAGVPLDERENRRRLDQAVDLETDRRIHPRQIEQAVAGDVDEGFDSSDALQDFHRFGDVDMGRPQQLLAERGAELVELVIDP